MTCRDCRYYKRRCMDRFRGIPCRGFRKEVTQDVADVPVQGVQRPERVGMQENLQKMAGIRAEEGSEIQSVIEKEQ